MKNKRAKLILFIAIPTITILCIAILITSNVVLNLPSDAQVLFGPPGSNLSNTQVLNLSYKLINAKDSLLFPIDSNGSLVEFSIDSDQPIPIIVSNLFDDGLILNQEAFTNYLIYKGFDIQVQAGTYTLSPSLTPVEIALTFLDASPKTITFTLLPGLRIEEVAEALTASGFNFTPQEFITTANLRPTGINFITKTPYEGTLEGFLLPDTYQILRTSTAEEVFKTFLASFDRQVLPNIRSGFTQQGLSLYQGVTLASIIEREAIVDEEKGIIASVFLNRLNNNMFLETDPTVQYVLGYNQTQSTWWTNPLSVSDLKIDSPYNTYQYPGLPPGAISNPSLTSLRAVAFPEVTNYLFFRAACDSSGTHNFAFTFEEHLANGCN